MSSDTEVVVNATQDHTNTEAGATEGVTSTATEVAPSAEASGPSIEDQAAYDYRNLIPKFYGVVDFMPKKQLLRVMKALVEYPLENQKPTFSYTAERQAFYLGMQLFDCKFVLMRAVLELAKDKAAVKALQAELAAKEGTVL